MTKPEIAGIAPLFIVNSVPTALAFYRDRLGFDITFQGPEPDDIFFHAELQLRRHEFLENGQLAILGGPAEAETESLTQSLFGRASRTQAIAE